MCLQKSLQFKSIQYFHQRLTILSILVKEFFVFISHNTVLSASHDHEYSLWNMYVRFFISLSIEWQIASQSSFRLSAKSIRKLAETHPEVIRSAADPQIERFVSDWQTSLRIVQKIYRAMIRMSIFCQIKRRNFLASLDMSANSGKFRYY